MIKNNFNFFIAIFLFLFISTVAFILSNKNKNKIENFDMIHTNDDFLFNTENSSELNTFYKDKSAKINRLCIYSNDYSKMECLTPQEYKMALNFPRFRRELICIDEECININDIEILRSDKAFNLKGRSKTTISNHQANKDYCLQESQIKMSSCAGSSFNDLDIITRNNCSSNLSFKFGDSDNTETNYTVTGRRGDTQSQSTIDDDENMFASHTH